jgi:hypothetical protein
VNKRRDRVRRWCRTEKQRCLEPDNQILRTDARQGHAEFGFEPLVRVIFRAHRNDSSFDELEIIILIDEAVRLHAADVLCTQMAE